MAVEIKFTCNICFKSYTRDDDKNSVPSGWGAVRPTLKVTYPPYGSIDDGKRKEKQKDETRKRIIEAARTLKKQLQKSTYHICPDCLQLSQDKILKIEQGKKR